MSRARDLFSQKLTGNTVDLSKAMGTPDMAEGSCKGCGMPLEAGHGTRADGTGIHPNRARLCAMCGNDDMFEASKKWPEAADASFEPSEE